jgi:hypothetical protein
LLFRSKNEGTAVVAFVIGMDVIYAVENGSYGPSTVTEDQTFC